MNSKTTKRALLTSALAIVMCVAMLVGTTFAWFTDTASTAVNKIQAGNLHIELQYATEWDNETGAPTAWANAEGKTLNFKTADGRTTGILWEPGCRYVLPELRIVNKGNLALKYNIVISGIAGDAKLNEVIDWEYAEYALQDGKYEESLGGSLSDGDEISGMMIPGVNDDATDPIMIKGHMLDTADNTYQGLYIDSVAITVYATQFNYEKDSFGDDYDETADMTPDNLDKLMVANLTTPVNKDADGNIIATSLANTPNGEPADYANPNFTVAAEVPAEAIDPEADELKLIITPKTSVPSGITVASNQGVMPYEITIEGLKADNEVAIPVTFFIGKGLENVQVYHNTKALSTYGVGVEDWDGFGYNPENGFLMVSPKSFSPFTILYDAPEVTVGDVAYYDFATAIKNAPEGSTITFLKSTTETLKFVADEETTLKNLTFKAASGVKIKGLQLISAKASTHLTLDGITFEGISFTDVVVVGQDKITKNLSQCSNITFNGCKFDLTNSQAAKTARYGIKCSAYSEDDAKDIIVTNCTFANVARGVYFNKARNATVKDCTFTNCSSYAMNFSNFVGRLNIIGNTIDQAKSALFIAAIANNYTITDDIQTDVVIKNNTATGMTCDNGDVFMANYDNAKQSGKSTYEITGNKVTYTEDFDEPLNGFNIKKTYGPSVAEFIENK